tara:strand:- start:631 stop:864 length:234 start_codon:yes stop_codon:yes gene_type:complete
MVPFSYKNQSNHMVVLRCIGPNRFFIEKVVLSSEIFSLMAPYGSRVEVWGGNKDGMHLEERHRLPQPHYEIKESITA